MSGSDIILTTKKRGGRGLEELAGDMPDAAMPGIVTMTIFMPLSDDGFRRFLAYVDDTRLNLVMDEPERTQFATGVTNFVYQLGEAQMMARVTLGKHLFKTMTRISSIKVSQFVRHAGKLVPVTEMPKGYVVDEDDVSFEKVILDVPYDTEAVGILLHAFMREFVFGRMESVFKRPMSPRSSSTPSPRSSSTPSPRSTSSPSPRSTSTMLSPRATSSPTTQSPRLQAATSSSSTASSVSTDMK